MNNTENWEADVTGRFINPGKIEKAPEGFTERVMMQIRLENVPVKLHQRPDKIILIPAVAFFTIIALIIIAGLTTSSESLFLNSVSQLIAKIPGLIPAINLDKISGLTLPGILLNVTIGILFLSLFDFALNRIFRKRER